MNKDEIKERGRTMNVIAAGQSLLGQVMQFGKGMVPHKSMEEPAFMVEGSPVYHIGYNPFELDYDCIRQNLIKWGEFTHPFMMSGMPDVPGKVKLYLDSSVDGHYLMLGRFQLDPGYSGPSYPYWNIVCWTPVKPGDSRQKAGTRMFHAMVMHMDSLADETTVYDGYSLESPDWESEWAPSIRCREVFRKVRK